ncbi:MAG: PVC-type heme-binding CxxCH protein [Pirellulaceae bacterium]
MRSWICFAALTFFATPFPAGASSGQDVKPLRLLFLGDNGLHRPAKLAEILIPELAKRNINVEYTSDVKVLRPEGLDPFDGLILYANIVKITPEQETALLNFVRSGRGFIPLHCASFCFLNSDKFIALVGAQFKQHGGEVFSTVIAEPDHPIMKDFEGFQSWDETYIHHKHNPDGRTVLEYRVAGGQAKGNTREPWTWVRNEGKGRVFYTAWGHDSRTWTNPGFQNLIERGIRWSCGGEVAAAPYRSPNNFSLEMTQSRKDVRNFEYVEVGAKIPRYIAGAVWGIQEAPQTTMQKPLEPEESIKHFVTPVGFEMKLFASERNLEAKPLAMNWDHRGRLWVCESIDYPNDLAPQEQGRDRIRILEDADNDGAADKFTLFADKLSVPTTLLCCYGGAIVQCGTETLFLKDTNGDDRADVRTVLISNWTLGDTHGGVSNFHYGHDNWIWAMQGYNRSEPIVNGHKQPLFAQGFFRFKLKPGSDGIPQVEQLEFIRGTNNNTWGLGFSEEGIIFGSTANGNPSVYLSIPNRYYERVRGWTPSLLAPSIADKAAFYPITKSVRQVDHHGNYSAAAGHALYTARNYPKQYWNRTAFVCGPEGHLVGLFVISPNGASYSSTSPGNLVASDDEWTAPIMVEVGPDGNVWIIDWYNYVVQHNPTPLGFETGKGNAYVSDLRDKKHGRIYRLLYTGKPDAPLVPQPKLDPDNPKGLVAALAHPTMHIRLQAQRLLVERGKQDILPELIELAQDRSVDELGLNAGAIHALWTLHGLGITTEREKLEQTIAHPSWGVRRAALTTLPVKQKDPSFSETHPQVQLATLLAIADGNLAGASGIGNDGSWQIIQSLPESVFADNVLREALICAAASDSEGFLSSLLLPPPSAGNPWGNWTGSAPAEQATRHEVVRIVAEHHTRGGDVDANDMLGGITSYQRPFAEAILGGLIKGWPKDKIATLTPETEKALLEVLPSLSPQSRAGLFGLADQWNNTTLLAGANAIKKALVETIQDEVKPDDERINSAQQLVSLAPSDDNAAKQILDAINVRTSPELVLGLIQSLRASSARAVGELLVGKLSSWPPTARREGILVLLGRTDTARTLLKGIEKGEANWNDLTLDQRQALAQHPDKSLSARAKRLLEAGGGKPDSDRAKVLAELMPLTQKTGNVAKGKEIFKRDCAKCHRHGSEGVSVGPDLTGMSVHPKSEMLLNIVDPSRSVEANFRAYTVALADGRVQNGLLAAESKSVIEMVDGEGKRIQIPREDVDEIIASRKSFMPEGFEKQMKPDEIVDLLEFLAARGKFTPLDLRKVATTITTRGMFNAESADMERLIFPDWSPKTFEGVPFVLVDPQGDRVANAIMLHGNIGEFPPRMPSSVKLLVNQPVKAIHFLGGVSGWGYPAHANKSVTMIVRIHYADDQVETHDLLNGVHFADYIRRVDVPGSKLAYMVRGQQVRYFAIVPKRTESVKEIELVKGGDDPTAPVTMAITAEAP